MWPKLPSPTACWAWTGPTCSITSSPAFYVLYHFLHGLILAMLVIYVDPNGHNLRNPLASVFIGLVLKVCTMTTSPKLFFNSFSQYRSSLVGFLSWGHHALYFISSLVCLLKSKMFHFLIILFSLNYILSVSYKHMTLPTKLEV